MESAFFSHKSDVASRQTTPWTDYSLFEPFVGRERVDHVLGHKILILVLEY